MISQTNEYALRAMIFLASNREETSLTRDAIAARTKVPRDYLSKVLRDLVLAKLITSQRGPNGGFVLARSASAISILDVVNAVDPLTRIESCPLGNPEHMHLCPLHKRLDDALATVEREFARTTLADVLASTPSEHGKQCRTLTAPSISARRSP